MNISDSYWVLVGNKVMKAELRQVFPVCTVSQHADVWTLEIYQY